MPGPLYLSGDVSLTLIGKKHQVVNIWRRLGVRPEEFFNSDQLEILCIWDLRVGSDPLHAITRDSVGCKKLNW